MAPYLRKATEADAEILFRWRNEPETRANSFHTELIPYEEHVAWLADAIRNPAQEIYIFCDGDVLIGQVRLSTEGDAATISYSIDAAYRAQGYGQEMLRCVENLSVERRTPKILRGYVKQKNIASQVIFESLGYTRENASDLDCFLYVKHQLQHWPSCERKICGGGTLFLTNNRNALPLYEWLAEHGETVTLYSGRLSVDMLERLHPKWVISYNYSYIVPKEIIALLHGHIVNLHASYLPWNRGASPNFWSFVEDAPKGVSIHFMDEGLDTGDLIAQEELVFEEERETFRSSYETLNDRMVQLFCRIWPMFSAGEIVGKQQTGKGSFHTMKDFAELLDGETLDWDLNVATFKRWLKARRSLIADNKKAADYCGNERQP